MLGARSRRSFIFLTILLVLSAPAFPALAEISFFEKPDSVQPVLEQMLAANGAQSQRQDILDLYASRAFQPVWSNATDRAGGLIQKIFTQLHAIRDYHGLSPKDFPEDEINALISSEETTDHLRLDILFTSYVMKLAHALSGDRPNLSILYVGWDFEKPPSAIREGLSKAIEDNEVMAYLNALAPTHFDYAAYASALTRYRELEKQGGWGAVPPGDTLKTGMTDSRVLAVRQRLTSEGYLTTDQTSSPLYSTDLEQAVRAYQVRNGLETDGHVGKKTLSAMNVPIEARINQIRANMERIRHLPRTYPHQYTLVNIASNTLKVFRGSDIIFEMPVITGRRDRKSPFIQSAIKSVIFNPSWHVPSRIAREDILPKLRKDPHYLQKQGIIIKEGDNGDPHGTMINWNTISPSEFTFRLRQEPGAMNALGRIKFDFDNNFSVYMHGTPHEELFEKASRHLSSGCVRLQDPISFATLVLAENDSDWDNNKVKRLIDNGKTRSVPLSSEMPVYFIYQTAFFVKGDDAIYFTPDDYDYDRILLEALNGRN